MWHPAAGLAVLGELDGELDPVVEQLRESFCDPPIAVHEATRVAFRLEAFRQAWYASGQQQNPRERARGALTAPTTFQVRCPFCHEPSLADTAAGSESIVCQNCRGTFSLAEVGTDHGDSHPGAKIAHFELLERLGEGSYGTVWKAHDTVLHRMVALWDATSGRRRHVFADHRWPVDDCAFSPDGSQVLAYDRDNQIHVWDLASGKCVQTMPLRLQRVRDVAFSPVAPRLAVARRRGEDSELSIYDYQAQTLVKRIPAFETTIGSLAFSADGSRLAIGEVRRAIRIWQVEPELHLLATLAGPVADKGRVVFDAAGERVAAEAQVWAKSAADGTLLLATTAADGTYELSGLPLADWELTFAHPDYVDSAVLAFNAGSATTYTKDHQLSLGASVSGTITGLRAPIRLVPYLAAAYNPAPTEPVSCLFADEILSSWSR
jgi:hypothetical protein